MAPVMIAASRVIPSSNDAPMLPAAQVRIPPMAVSLTTIPRTGPESSRRFSLRASS